MYYRQSEGVIQLMPLLMPPPPPAAAEVRSLWDGDDTPLPQGQVGQSLHARLYEVLNHWNQRARQQQPDVAEEATPLAHVPLKIIGTIRVVYDKAVRLAPTRYAIDDDE